MLNKLQSFISRYGLLKPGDRVTCAVSGGADSVALLFAMHLLQEKLNITVHAAHFNHKLRAEESDRDEAFVRNLCDRLGIPLEVGSKQVTAGKKGLEAAARDARYAFLNTLEGKLATAHTANDNAETVLMHMIRGTGLKGLGGIAPVSGRLIRPMLDITRADILSFLKEYNLSFVEDSTNATDTYLRNRIRHRIFPLLEQENPQLAVNMSAMAQRLRWDEAYMQSQAQMPLPDVSTLQQMPPALRSRVLSHFLEESGVKEPESEHITLTERLVYSKKPSARANLRDGIVVTRRYDTLQCTREQEPLKNIELTCPGSVEIPQSGVRIVCHYATHLTDEVDCFTVIPRGKLVVRAREAGDAIRLSGGKKELKKLFIDRKIPAADRLQVPVIADSKGVVGVFGFGASRDRVEFEKGAVCIRIEPR